MGQESALAVALPEQFSSYRVAVGVSAGDEIRELGRDVVTGWPASPRRTGLTGKIAEIIRQICGVPRVAGCGIASAIGRQYHVEEMTSAFVGHTLALSAFAGAGRLARTVLAGRALIKFSCQVAKVIGKGDRCLTCLLISQYGALARNFHIPIADVVYVIKIPVNCPPPLVADSKQGGI